MHAPLTSGRKECPECFPLGTLDLRGEVVFGVGFALLLPILFGLDGVLYSMPVSDILTFVLSCSVVRSTCKALRAA